MPLKTTTPNGELANVESLAFSLSESVVFGCAKSADFEGSVRIRKRYCVNTIHKYSCFLFFKKGASDRDVFYIRPRENEDERIGFIFPLRTLGSSDHPWADDEYFQVVASSVFWNCIDELACYSKPAAFKDDQCYEVSDFYHEDLFVLALRNSGAGATDIYRIIAALLGYGFALYEGKLPLSEWRSLDLPKGKSLKVRSVAQQHADDSYIRDLLIRVIPFETNALAAFIQIYQVFEILMQKVFEDKLADFRSALSMFSGTPSDLRTLGSSLNECASERDRIRRAVAESSADPHALMDALNDCVAILDSVGRDSNGLTFPDAFYEVRNLVVHNYRLLTTQSPELISSLNRSVLRALPGLLS